MLILLWDASAWPFPFKCTGLMRMCTTHIEAPGDICNILHHSSKYSMLTDGACKHGSSAHLAGEALGDL